MFNPDGILTSSEEQHTFLPEFEERMTKLIASVERKSLSRQILKICRNIAAVIVVVFAAASALMLFSPGVRAAVVDMFAEWFDTSTNYSIEGGGTASDPLSSWQITEPLDGFAKNVGLNDEGIYSISFINDVGVCIFFSIISGSMNGSGSVAVDNEHSRFEIVTHDGIDYNVFSSNQAGYPSHVIWKMSGNLFSIDAELPIKDLMRIVYTVKRTE